MGQDVVAFLVMPHKCIYSELLADCSDQILESLQMANSSDRYASSRSSMQDRIILVHVVKPGTNR